MVAVTVSVTVRRRIISENLLLLTIFHINTFKSHRNIEKLSFWSSKNIENNSMWKWTLGILIIVIININQGLLVKWPWHWGSKSIGYDNIA